MQNDVPSTNLPLNDIPDAASDSRHQHVQQNYTPQLRVIPHRHTKTVHLIRHGRGYHNVAGALDPQNYTSELYADSHLDDLGWEQVSFRPEICMPTAFLSVQPMT